jgi:alkanesulfonate monooxygenase SsuD/methylene tetrahydromethanopterin reductase-like flavin-dependent oxidoreductase (luciferase family)
MVERWRFLEELGFDSLWVADHYAHLYKPKADWLDGWTLLTALATQTSRVRLGALVTNMMLHNPAMLAKQAITIDHISGGRLEVGLGSGTPGDISYGMVGVEDLDPPQRVGRFREFVEMMDSLLRNEETTYEGRYYSVKGAILNPRPVQEPRPPLTVAALGPTMLQIAAKYADRWNTYPGRGVEPQDVLGVVRGRNEMLSEYCEKIGRDPGEITRSLLVYGRASIEAPFASVAAFEDFVGQYREIGIEEFVFYYPPEEWYPGSVAGENEVFERVAREVIPAMRKG